MEDNFRKAKAKAEELGLNADQIKAALRLFAYCKTALHVDHYLKEGDKLGLKLIEKKKTQPNPLKGTSGEDIWKKAFGID